MPADESNGIVGSHMRYLCNLTVKLRGRVNTPDKRRGRTISASACGAKPLTRHGPLLRLLGPSGRVASELMRVDDKAKMLGELVIQCTPGSVRGLSLPVNSRTPTVTGRLVHRLNQASPDTTTSNVFGREEILQIADITQSGCAAMEHIVRETNEMAGPFRNDCLHRLGRVEEPFPRGLSDLFGKCRGAAAVVEGVVPVPERSPLVVVGTQDGSNRKSLGHGVKGPNGEVERPHDAASSAIRASRPAPTIVRRHQSITFNYAARPAGRHAVRVVARAHRPTICSPASLRAAPD